MHGGAGALISIGMLKAVDFDEMEDCVLREWSTGKSFLLVLHKSGMPSIALCMIAPPELYSFAELQVNDVSLQHMSEGIFNVVAAFAGGDSFITICLWKVDHFLF